MNNSLNVALDFETVDNIIRDGLTDTYTNLRNDYENRKKGIRCTIPMVSHDDAEDDAYLKNLLESFETVIDYHCVPDEFNEYLDDEFGGSIKGEPPAMNASDIAMLSQKAEFNHPYLDELIKAILNPYPGITNAVTEEQQKMLRWFFKCGYNEALRNVETKMYNLSRECEL